MKKYNIFSPIFLRVYEIGLSCLNNRDWLFVDFRRRMEWSISQQKSPNGLFFRTIPNGLLYVLGSAFFDQIFSINDDVLFCDAQTAFTRSSEVYFLLHGSGCSDSSALFDLIMAIDEVDYLLSETPQQRVNSAFHRQKLHFLLHEALDAVSEYYKNDIDELRKLYAKRFSEHIIHNRQICEYVSFAFTEMYEEKGFPIFTNGEMTITKVKRQRWPSWTYPTLLARERGKCAICGGSFMELESESQIDHIVPLSHGGFNDIVNLQLLCDKCNLNKLDKKILVNSSVPEYLNWHRKTRSN